MAADVKDRGLRNYVLVTLAYWSFTLSDGALRMLVLLHFHRLGYSPLSLASLFLLYELCGVFTNLIGGWIGGRLGLKFTLSLGLLLQVGALVMLSQLAPAWPQSTQVLYVLLAQGVSGIAKDFTKISAKSAIKVVAPRQEGTLYRWVAILTGSKNALKGAGFFLGGLLLAKLGFARGLLWMAGGVGLTALATVLLVPQGLGRAKHSSPLRALLSQSPSINLLSLARFFLFGARDIWFVVALPIFLTESLRWSFVGVGSYMAAWVIGYGLVQAATPRLLPRADHKSLPPLAFLLALVPACMLAGLQLGLSAHGLVLGGLALFGVLFALNSAVHSYLILHLAQQGAVAEEVGFYYMANAGGRLIGTLLSGLLFQLAGFLACLAGSTLMLGSAGLLSVILARHESKRGNATMH